MTDLKWKRNIDSIHYMANGDDIFTGEKKVETFLGEKKVLENSTA